MIQRKLSMKRVHPELELEETETPDDLSVPVKPVRKISKGNTEQPRLEELQTDPVDNENTRDLAEDTNIEVSEVDKNDILDDVQSSKDTTDQDSQSGTVSGLDDSSQEAGGSKRLRMYKCERCNTQYMGLAMLRQHCRDVHGDQKYYKCHVCGKLFSHPSSRNIHLRLHSGEKPYKCTTCGKQFRVSSHLKDHVRVHTGERPYICDICQKGFKQSSDLKKHRRTHTLDKPYKCPICPSAFTRSHHCRGHINSVHKFFKCVACSALFTSEEAFERHKEFHPSVFPDQADGERTPPEVSDSAQKGNARKESAQEEHDIHENNVKLDVANQLLELHKIMQQRSPLSTTTGSGSDTASDSGDDVSNRQSPAPDQVKPAEPEPTAAASPGLMYQEVSRRLSTSASHMEQVHSVPLKMTDDGVEIRVPQRYCHSLQPNPQGMGYLRVPFQSTIQVENRATSPEQPGLVGGSLPERRRKSPVDPSMNVFHYTVNGIPQVQPMLQFAVSVDPRRHYTNAETFPRAEISRKSSVEAPKTTESQNTVPCHRVSVIQYHSSSPKPSGDEKSEEGSRKSSLQEADFKSRTSPLPETASKTLDNARPMDQTPNNMMPQSYGLTMNNMKYLVGVPPERIPYMPHAGEGMMILQPWMKELNKQIGNYSWMVKDETKTSEEFTTRGPAMLYNPAKFPLDVAQANAEPSTSPYNAQTSQDVPTDMLKYLSLREQNKPKNEARDRRTPTGDDDSETSEASENGDEPNSRKLSAGARQESPSSESLSDPKDSSENSVHLCQVCNKTFSRSSLLKQHSVIHMGNKRFKFRCEVCGKMFRTRSHLRDHTRIHTGERPFKCHICQKAFKQSSDLKKHINLHTGANQFKCEECNMEFRRADALRKHKLGHKVGNMPCAHCGKNFLHIGALRAHRAMHNVQPVKASRSFHRCNYCFKTFTKAESYKIHIEEHTRDQSGAVVIFDCKICSMKFFTEAEFQDHMNIHNGKRPYKCFVCDKEFCIAEHLQDHVRLHSDATPRVRCEEGSDRSFQMPDQVIRHSAIHA